MNLHSDRRGWAVEKMCINHTRRMEGDLEREGQEGDGFFEFSTTFFFVETNQKIYEGLVGK